MCRVVALLFVIAVLVAAQNCFCPQPDESCVVVDCANATTATVGTGLQSRYAPRNMSVLIGGMSIGAGPQYDPENIIFPNLYNVTGPIHGYGVNGVKKLLFPLLRTAGSIYIDKIWDATELDLSSLETTGGFDVETFPSGSTVKFDKLRTVGADFRFWAMNMGIFSLNSLVSVKGKFEIRSSESNLLFSVPNLTTVDSIEIYQNRDLASIYLPSLTTITGTSPIMIYSNEGLKTISMPLLQQLPNLDVRDSPALTVIELTELTSIQSTLSLNGTGLKEFVLPKLATAGAVEITYHNSLTNISLPSLTTVQSWLTLRGNTALRNISFSKLTSAPTVAIFGSPELCAVCSLCGLTGPTSSSTKMTSDYSQLSQWSEFYQQCEAPWYACNCGIIPPTVAATSGAATTSSQSTTSVTTATTIGTTSAASTTSATIAATTTAAVTTGVSTTSASTSATTSATTAKVSPVCAEKPPLCANPVNATCVGTTWRFSCPPSLVTATTPAVVISGPVIISGDLTTPSTIAMQVPSAGSSPLVTVGGALVFPAGTVVSLDLATAPADGDEIPLFRADGGVSGVDELQLVVSSVNSDACTITSAQPKETANGGVAALFSVTKSDEGSCRGGGGSDFPWYWIIVGVVIAAIFMVLIGLAVVGTLYFLSRQRRHRRTTVSRSNLSMNSL